MNRLQQKYLEEVVPVLMKELDATTTFALPKLKKIVLNMGVTDPTDPRARKDVIANIVVQFRAIAGQQPQVTKARKSIAGFKLREGDPLGVMVTLRGERMWDFLDKLIAVTLPRVKDFQGVSRTAFDQKGNYNLGLHEQIVFPEIVYDQIERSRGLQLTFVTQNSNEDRSRRMLELLGVPFAKEKTNG
ncbi:MAG: 50S ribosomal protein L5 [bacterium]|nr:50S ribosomal protein L5 [bacterium]